MSLRRETVKVALTIILSLVCIIAIGNAGYKLLWSTEVNTLLTIERKVHPLPSMTICPTYIKDEENIKQYHLNATTLTEFYETLPRMKDLVFEAVLYSGESDNPIDLTESWTVDDFMYAYIPEADPLIVRCGSFSFNLTSSPLNWLTTLIVRVNMTMFDEVIIDLHPREQSMSSTRIGMGSNAAEYNKDHATFYLKELKAERLVQLNRPDHKCRTNADRKTIDCIDDFIESELQCDLPWSGKRSHPGVCSDPGPYGEIYRQFAREPLNDINQRLEDFGCLIPYCENVKWGKMGELHAKDESADQIRVVFQMPAGEPVKVFTEEASYGFASFVADFGGYLGLFLGASFLTFYDIFSSLCERGK